MNIIKLKAKHVFAIGDIDEDFTDIFDFLKIRELSDSAVICCLGSNKRLLHEELLEPMNSYLSQRGVFLYFVGGGHGVAMDFSNIFAVPDYTVLSVQGEHKDGCRNYLCLGGAPLLDDEVLDELVEEDILINCVCAHHCPDFCTCIGNYDDDGERNVMTAIFTKLMIDGHEVDTWTSSRRHNNFWEEIDGVHFLKLNCARGDIFHMVEITAKETDN